MLRVAAAAVVLGGVAVATAARGSADPALPSVGLRAVLTHVDASRQTGDTSVYLQPGVVAQAVHGSFEIDVVTTATGTTLWQVRRDDSGVHRLRQITAAARVNVANGLPGFFVTRVTDAHGNVVSNSRQDFCPTASSRMDPTGPINPTFPFTCGSALTQTTVWGLDQGWGAELFPAIPFRKSLPDGNYSLTISIAHSYAAQLQIPTSAASVTASLTVATGSGVCNPLCPPDPHPGALRGRVGSGQHSLAANTSTQGIQGTPDMRALPAHDLSTETDSGHDYLDFAATIWNAGSGPLWLEGFRNGTSSLMPVTQFFYSDDQPTGSQAAGAFVFDDRVQHNVWDMPDIAQYDLLSATGTTIIQSQKQSFCLGATDPINLTQPGAEWQPGQYDSSTCGGMDAAWIRETLDAGWGDTYVQNAACQAFDITKLPNGTYQIRVTTDPHHVLAETSYSNNIALLKVRVGGTPGHRTVAAIG